MAKSFEKCDKCGKKGVYTKRGWEFGYGRNAKVCRYCGKVWLQKGKVWLPKKKEIE